MNHLFFVTVIHNSNQSLGQKSYRITNFSGNSMLFQIRPFREMSEDAAKALVDSTEMVSGISNHELESFPHAVLCRPPVEGTDPYEKLPSSKVRTNKKVRLK